MGCGHWGRNHVRVLSELGALTGLVDPRDDVAAAAAARFGARPMRFQDVLADESVHGVVIASPARRHAEQALEALGAGKHVLVEKPMALSLRDGEAMALAAERAGRVLMVGHLMRHHGAFKALLAAVKAGAIGRLRHACATRLNLGRFRVDEDVLWSFAPHDVSMLLALFGDATPIEVRRSGGAWLTPGVADVAHLDLAWADGACAQATASWLHPFKERRLVVVGDAGMACFDDTLRGPDRLRVWRTSTETIAGVPSVRIEEPLDVPFADVEPLRAQAEHFLRCMTGDEVPIADAAEGLRVIDVLSRADRSDRPAGSRRLEPAAAEARA